MNRILTVLGIAALAMAPLASQVVASPSAWEARHPPMIDVEGWRVVPGDCPTR